MAAGGQIYCPEFSVVVAANLQDEDQYLEIRSYFGRRAYMDETQPSNTLFLNGDMPVLIA